MKLLNAISLNMLPFDGCIHVKTLEDQDVKNIIICPDLFGKLESFIGHKDTASVVNYVLNSLLNDAKENSHLWMDDGREKIADITVDIKENRKTITLKPTEEVLVAQYIGERLPEGATTLPEGAKIAWKLCWFEDELNVLGGN